jgi:hypothetical protein
MLRSQSHQDLARERHAQLIRNASIRYVSTVTYAPTSSAGHEPVRRRRGTFASLFRRAALVGA